MGLLSAQEYAAEGAKVVLTDVHGDAVMAAANDPRTKGSEALGLEVDVRCYAQVKAAVSRTVEAYGRVDILLNCAGGNAARVFARSDAIYGAPHDIRACCVSPGPVLTRPAMAQMKTRLGRAAEPQEITSLILYLSSDAAAFITGANYVIDGGRSVGAG